MKTNKTTRVCRGAHAGIAAILVLALLAGCAAVAPAALTEDDNPPEQPAALAGAPEPAPADGALPPVSLAGALPGEDGFAILFVNVGKGDAAILRFGETTALIDTGSAASAPQLIAGLNALSVTAIDAVFITHSHSDHLGGLDALAANYEIPMVYCPLFSEQDKDGEGKIVKRAEKLNLAHQTLLAGDRVAITGDVSFEVLGPLALNKEDDNDNSLVLRFSYGGKTFLFAGDMQFAEEQTIIDSGADISSDVLKVGNHGNPDATGEAFAALVSPAFAVISTSTREDANSANARVFAALSTAEVFVTQDFAIGALLTLDETGGILVSNPARNAAPLGVVMQSLDAEHQLVTLVNNGATPADLSGCILFSARSNAVLRFPEATVLPTGASLLIGQEGDLAFPGEEKPLSKKKKNAVTLYDSLGAILSEISE